MRRKRGTIWRWWSSPVRLFFGEILSRSIRALFPDKFLVSYIKRPRVALALCSFHHHFSPFFLTAAKRQPPANANLPQIKRKGRQGRQQNTPSKRYRQKLKKSNNILPKIEKTHRKAARY
jgi:hypothetical protein